MSLQEINLAPFPVFIPQLLSLAAMRLNVDRGLGMRLLQMVIVKSRKCRKLQIEAKGLHVYYRCSHLHM